MGYQWLHKKLWKFLSIFVCNIFQRFGFGGWTLGVPRQLWLHPYQAYFWGPQPTNWFLLLRNQNHWYLYMCRSQYHLHSNAWFWGISHEVCQRQNAFPIWNLLVYHLWTIQTWVQGCQKWDKPTWFCLQYVQLWSIQFHLYEVDLQSKIVFVFKTNLHTSACNRIFWKELNKHLMSTTLIVFPKYLSVWSTLPMIRILGRWCSYPCPGRLLKRRTASENNSINKSSNDTRHWRHDPT